MAKGKPGEWSVSSDENSTRILCQRLIGKRRKTIANVFDSETQEAFCIALLMAAAPEMLQVLNRVSETAEDGLKAEIQAVIAKATGN